MINKYRNRFLPNNYLGLADSIIGLSSAVGTIVKQHNKLLTFDCLCKEFKLLQQSNKSFIYHKITDVFLALNFLHMIGVVDVKDGKLFIIEL